MPADELFDGEHGCLHIRVEAVRSQKVAAQLRIKFVQRFGSFADVEGARIAIFGPALKALIEKMPGYSVGFSSEGPWESYQPVARDLVDWLEDQLKENPT